MRDSFAGWLKAQGYSENSCASRQADVRTVERAYGEELDDMHARVGPQGLAAQLVYSSVDQRRGRPNPSKVDIKGDIRNGLATIKGAVMPYARFLGENWTEPSSGSTAHGVEPADEDQWKPSPVAVLDDQKRALEKDMERFVRRTLDSLEQGLTIIDDGAERAVTSGFIDILARDKEGATVVIEMKAGRTDARVVGQILGYTGVVADGDAPAALRGIIVAHDFDQRTRSAACAVPNLKLVRYSVTFHFSDEPSGDA